MKDFLSSKIKENFLIKTLTVLILVVCFTISSISSVLAARDFKVQSVGGTPFFFIEGDNGRVGISTINPGYILDILSPDSTDSYMRVQRYDGDVASGIMLSTGASTPLWTMYTDGGSSDLLFEEDGTVAATITTDGYFGIGPDYLTPTGLLDVNNKFIVTDTQVTMNVPLNLAAAGDISIASDLQFTSPTASYIKSYAPLYIEAGDPSQNVDLTLRGSNLGEVIVDDNFKVTGEVDVSDNKIVSLGTPTEGTDAATKGYVDSSLVSGDSDWAGVGGDPTLAGEIYHTGNVGIGTTDPGAKLEIEGGIVIDNGYAYSVGGGNSSGTQVLIMGNDSGTPYLKTGTSRNLKIGSNSYPTSIFIEGATGNVGIGTITPDAGLEIISSLAEKFALKAINTNATYGDGLYVKGGGSSGVGYVVSFDNAAGSNKMFIANTGTTYINGDVGIGSTSPATKLDVAGNIQSAYFYDRDNSNYYLNPAAGGTGYSLYSSGSVYASGVDDNYFAGNIDLAPTKSLLGSSLSSGNLNMITESQAPSGMSYARGWVWSSPSGTITTEEVDFMDGKKVRAIKIVTDGNSYIYPPKVQVDPNKTYKFSIWIKTNSSGAGARYFGLYGYNSVGSQIGVLNSNGTENTNPYFWAGDPTQNKWVYFETFVYPTSSVSAPSGWRMDEDGNYSSSVTSFKWNTNTETALIRILNYYNEGTTVTDYFYMPRIVEIGEDQSIADSRYQIGDFYIKGGGLDVDGDLSVDGGDVTTDGSGNITAGSFYDKDSVLYYLDPSETGTALNVAGVIQANGSGDNYFAGNVGIGVTSPDTKLHVGSDAAVADVSLLTLENGDGTGDIGQQKTFIDFNFVDSNSNYIPQVRIGAEVGPNGNADTTDKEGSGSFVVYTSPVGASGPASERMRVDYAGNVGIGINDPQAKLDIRGGNLALDPAHNAYITDIATPGAGNTYYAANVAYVNAAIEGGSGSTVGYWTASGNNIYNSNTSGNVGIGTTVPGARLDVRGGNLLVDGDTYGLGPDAANTHLNIHSTGSAGNIRFFTQGTDVTASGGGGTEKVTIQYDGKIGIGTTVPSYKLEINGTDGTKFGISENSRHDLIFEPNASNALIYNYDTLSSGDYEKISLVGESIGFQIGNTSPTEKVTIDSSGHVGIGTTVASEELQVIGDLRLGATGEEDTTRTISSGGSLAIHANMEGTDGLYNDLYLKAGNATSSGQIRFATYNQQRMVINGSGNLAIGTTSAGFQLDVLNQDITTEESTIRIQRASASDQQVGLAFYTGESTALWSMYVPEGSSDLYWENNGEIDVVFSDDGYVGIGPDYLTPTGLLDVNNKFIVTDTQVTMNVPLNLAAAGDISIASDLQFTSPTASYIKSYAPLYLQAGDSNHSYDLTLRAFNSGEVVSDGQMNLSNNKIVNLGTPTEETDAATMGYVDSSLTSGDLDWSYDADPMTKVYNTDVDVGIGTDDPNAKLDVMDTGDTLLKVETSQTSKFGGNIVPWSAGSVGASGSEWTDMYMTGALYDGGTTYYINPDGASNLYGALDIGGDFTPATITMSGTIDTTGTIDAGEFTDDGSPTLTNNISGNAGTVDAHSITATTDNIIVRHDGVNLEDSGILDNSDARAITIDSGEEVGIGYATPAYRLDVNGHINARGAGSKYYINQTVGGDISCGSTFVLGQPTVSGGIVTAGTCKDISDIGGVAGVGNGTANYITKWSDADTITKTTTPIFELDGKIGIGTTVPQAPLHIKGTSTQPTWGYFPLLIEDSGSNYPGIAFKGTLGIHALIRVDDGDGLSFITLENSANEAIQLRILENGYVGIGSTSPATDLDVNGNIQSAYFYDRDNSDYYLNPAAGGTGLALRSSGSIYASGVDDNYFAGSVGIGVVDPGVNLDVAVPSSGAPTAIRLNGGGTSGTQLLLSTNYYGAVGQRYSSAWSFLSANAMQSSVGVDQWTKGSSTYSSNIITVGHSTANNSNAFQVLHSPANTVTGTYTNFFHSALFTVKEDGNVGIGITNPGAYKLNASGTIKSTSLETGGLKVTDSPGLNKVLTDLDGAGTAIWKDISEISGVTGPAIATDNAIARFDGTTGKIIQNSGVIIDDSGNVGIGTADPQQELHVQGDVIGSVYYDLVDSNYYLDPGSNTYSYGLYSKGSVYSEGSADNYFAGNVGIGTTVPDTILTIANDEWISAKDSAGTGHVNMFKVNTSNEIEVGGTLNIGTIGLAEDSGVVTLVNMPVSSTPSVGTEESYSFAIDSEAILKVYSEADGTGGIQNKRVGIGTIAPDYQLTVTEDFGFDDASMYIEDISGTTTVYSNNFYALGGSNYLKPADNTTSLNVAGSLNVLGTTNDNYFAGSVGIGVANPTGLLSLNYDQALWFESASTGYGGGLRYDRGGIEHLIMAVDSTSSKIVFDVGHNVSTNPGSTSQVPSDPELTITDGKVGIGTTSPGATLDVSGSSNPTIRLTNNFDTNYDTILGLNYGNQMFYMSNEGTKFFKTYGYNSVSGLGLGVVGHEDSVYINNDGNVGINTSTPTANKLVISGGGITFEGGGSHYITGMTPLGSGDPDTYAADKGYVDAAVEGSGGVGIWRDAGTYIYPNTSSNVVIEDGGDVGIGVTNPTKLLHLFSSANNLDTGAVLRVVSVGESAGQAVELASANTSTRLQHIEDATDASNGYGKMQFKTNAASTPATPTRGGFLFTGAADYLAITNTGNVGIGTTVPGAKLSVYTGYYELIDNSYDEWIFHKERTDGSQDMGLKGHSLGQISLWANSIEAMRVNNVGNVGIGTTSAGYKLDILSPDAIDSYMRVQRYDGDVASGIMLSTGASTPLWTMYTDGGSSDLLFEENGTVAATITTDGYFGIGPDYLTPTGLLDVNNKFIVTDTQVTMNVPLNLAAAGDISIASDLQFTSPTASYIKSYAPLYIEAGDPSQNVDLTLRGSNLGEVIVDDNLQVTGNAVVTGGLTIGSATLVGSIDMQNYDITGVDKLTVNTIDPIHEINGKEYATFVSFYAGGQKMETSGVVKLVNQVTGNSGNQEENKNTQSLSTQVPNPQFHYVIDFEKLEEGTDLWLFWETLHQDLSQLSVILTPGFDGRVWYEKIGDSKIIIHSDQPGEVSYTLVAPRYDYKKWPNLISKTD